MDELAKQGPYKKKGRARPSTAKKDALIAEAYHAGLSPGTRKAIQNRFISGRLRVIVATMAFGMGIDMRNIRSVIHFNMPKSIENYVQEIGRAGRDNQLSRCHLFLETAREDINDVKKYIHGDGYDNLIIKKLTMRIFEHCDQESCKYIKNPGNLSLSIRKIIHICNFFLNLNRPLKSTIFPSCGPSCWVPCRSFRYQRRNHTDFTLLSTIGKLYKTDVKLC